MGDGKIQQNWDWVMDMAALIGRRDTFLIEVQRIPELDGLFKVLVLEALNLLLRQLRDLDHLRNGITALIAHKLVGLAAGLTKPIACLLLVNKEILRRLGLQVDLRQVFQL